MQRHAMVRLLMLLAGPASIAASAPAISSHWKDRNIAVDGTAQDWTELNPVGDSLNVAASNDERDLYLAIATSDAQRRAQFAAAGLEIWLDPNGGKKETYGIRIPGSAPARPSNRVGGSPPDGTPEMPQPKSTYVELLGPGKDDRRRVDLTSGTSPVLAAAGIEMGTLLYELRIPFQTSGEDTPDALRVRPDRRSIGLGFKTPKLEAPADSSSRGGGFRGPRGGGGMGGGMGGPMGGRGGGMEDGPSRGFTRPAQLDRWTTLALAIAP